MTSTTYSRLLGAFVLAVAFATAAHGNTISLSLNLTPTIPGDLNSGGTWTTVAKADERGIAGIVQHFASGTAKFLEPSGFLVPFSVFEIQRSLPLPTPPNPVLVIEILQGDDLFPPTLDVGVIGGSHPYPNYTDNPALVLLPGKPNLGSFTGGVALATGTYDPGVIPTWASNLEGNSFNGSGQVVAATVQATVRYVNAVPEPTAALSALLAGSILLIVRRRA